MRCPHCKNRVLQKSGIRTRVRIKGPIIFEDDLCKAKCYWCKETIELPLDMQKGVELVNERFLLKNKST